MLPCTRIISLYERFTVLSAAAIRQEVQAMVGTNTAMCTAIPPLLQDVCKLLLKSGERQRVLIVADALPQAQRQSLVASLALGDSVHQPGGLAGQGQKTERDFLPAMELCGMSNEALLRLGFALQRPQNQRGQATCHSAYDKNKTKEEEEEEKAKAKEMYNAVMQRQLFLEFRRRRRYKELMQCVMNWKCKGLLPTKRGAGRRVGDKAHTTKDDMGFPFSTGGNSAEKAASASDAVSFNAEEALRGLILNTSSSSSSSSLASSTGNLWEEALREYPDFFVSSLRESTAALQFLRKTNADTLTRLALFLLKTDSAAHRMPHPSAAVANQLKQRVPWDTVAALCFALRPHLGHEKKVVKMDLLRHVLHALREESTTSGSMPQTTRLSGTTAAANDARIQAMRTTVESLCAPFLDNEAQARFVGLTLFIEIAVALCDCGVRIPNALVLSIFLCLGDSQLCQWNEPSSSPPPPLPTVVATEKARSPSPVRNSTPLDRRLFITILNSSPTERWIHALRLLHECHEQRDFAVSEAHLRCVLSGLQSISISRTWQVALRTTESITKQYQIFPDEASVEKLMLNLHAASWKRAFEVLQFYEKKRIAPSPLVLRDLQVVAMKHSSWDAVLRLMQLITEVSGAEKVDLMNYIYCLRAFGGAGKWQEAAHLFKELKTISGVEGGSPSVYNEVSVAVPVMGMMDHGHWESVVRFVVTVCRQCGPELTSEGRDVILAAEVIALTRIGNAPRLAFFLNKLAGEGNNLHDDAMSKTYSSDDPRLEGLLMPSSAEDLRAILLQAAQLFTLCGMEHLNAPVRLVFDIIATDKYRRNHHAERIGSVTHGMSPRRPLYLPPHHVQTQYDSFAVMLGILVRRDELLFTVTTQQAVAEAMAKIGAGSAFLKAALL